VTSAGTLADLLDVRLARTEKEVAAALELRHRVFCDEQGVSPAADRDGRDPEATHVVAMVGDRMVGTCRLLFRGRVARLGRLVVAREERRNGIGAQILGEAARIAREEGADRIELHAQTYARELYERDGYQEAGDEFVEEGIVHVAMVRLLA
jgi:predicted GNAT family N-acyltransferase